MPRPVEVRAVLHAPLNPVANLFYTDKQGVVVPLSFRSQAFSRSLFMMPHNGSLVLYDKADINPENPAASLAAKAKLPPGAKRLIVVVLPTSAGDELPYRLFFIEDTEDAFPKGGSLVLPLLNVNMAIQAGEHTIPLHPGKLTKVPPVKKVNAFNMAQTNFHYQRGKSWVTFAERQLQYIDACRRLFVIDATPGALQPRVTTIVDVNRR